MRAKTRRKRRSYERKANSSIAITPVEYGGLQEAYDHFNRELFGSGLPDVLITYQRRAHSYGYFSADRFAGRVGEFDKHELALNPDGFINRDDKEICSTLVHEQVHVAQHTGGTAPRRGYHNREWAAMMKAIGLQPSSTGMVGGRETGQRMSHYVIAGGPFEQTGWKLNLQSAARPGEQRKKKNKTTFTARTATKERSANQVSRSCASNAAASKCSRRA